MNSLTWTIYLIDLMDKFGTATLVFVCATGFLFLFSSGICAMMYSDDELSPETSEVYWKIFRRFVPIWFLAVGLLVIVPSKQTMILMAASQVGEKIINTETVSGIAKDSIDLLSSYVKKELKAIKQDEKK